MAKYNAHYILKQINLALLMAIFAFPLFPYRINTFLLIAFGLITAINYFPGERKKFKFNFILVLSLIFPLLYLLDFLVYPDSAVAWFEFEKRIAMFAMPVIFSITSIDVKKPRLFFAFNMSVLLLGFFVLFYLLVFGIHPEHTQGGLSYAIRATIEDLTGIHPTYFSLFAGFSFYLVLLDLLKNKDTTFISAARLLHLLILSALLVLLASKIFFLSTLFIVPLIVFRSPLKSLYQVSLLILFAVLFVLSVIFIPGLSQRISELGTSNIEIPANEEINSTNLRFGIYHCSIELLKNNFLGGVGTANLQNDLDQCYRSIDVKELYQKNYNTHNEYLNIWLGVGIAGLFVFLAILFFSFKKAMIHEEHLIFMALFCIFCLTENLLSRQHGVFMFAIVNYYFVFSGSSQTKEVRI